MRRALGVAFVTMCAVAPATSATAQGVDEPRVEVSGGARWIGSLQLADNSANEITLGNGKRALFESTTTLERSLGGTAMVGIRLSRMIRAEGAFAFNPTRFSTRVTADTEGVPDTTITSRVNQLLVEGGVLVEARRTPSRSVSPFVTAGAGYLRQLNDGRTLVETGNAYYVGGGLYYVRASARRRLLKAGGLRADVRALFMRKGVAPDSDWRPAPAVTAAIFVRF